MCTPGTDVQQSSERYLRVDEETFADFICDEIEALRDGYICRVYLRREAEMLGRPSIDLVPEKQALP